MKFDDIPSMVDEVISNRGKLGSITSLLYHEDMGQRLIAARTLGEIAKRDPELIKQRWERIFRAFDDTMSCWGAAEALGEIGRNLPERRSKIVLLLKAFKRDECSCQGYIWGMCRICQVDRDVVCDFTDELTAFLGSQNICMRAQAAWAVGELNIVSDAEKVKALLNDVGETWIFENDSASQKSVSQIAGEALRKLELSRE